MPTFDASGKSISLEDVFIEISGLTAVSFNDFLIDTQDVGQFRWLSLHIDGTWSGTLTFYGSNSTSFSTPNPSLLALTNIANGAITTRTTANGIFVGAINFRYLWVQMSAWTSGSATAVLELYYQPAPTNPSSFLGFYNAGGGVSASAYDTNSGVYSQRVSLYGQWSGVADTALQLGPSGAVITNESRFVNTIAAGVTTDTIIKASPGYLTQILVTALGTNAMQIYNNASVGSGTIIAIVPASTAAGTIVLCRAPGSAGITVKGNAANPAITYFYS